MAMQRRHWNIVAGGVLLAALAACGGGGGGDGNVGTILGGTTDTAGAGGGGTPAATAIADKYAGTWVVCRSDGSGGFEREVLTLQKASDTSVTFTSTTTGFAQAGCTGAVTSTESDSGTATFSGTKTIAGETVDKIDIVQNGQAMKQVVEIRADGKFYSGIDAGSGGTLDADGYPTTLETEGSTKAA